MTHIYLIALGSNIRHPMCGSPQDVVRTAFATLREIGSVERISRVKGSAPLGPSRRRYANAAAILQTDCAPEQLLANLKNIERQFGTRRGGRWQARVLDLDIVLWSGGMWASSGLSIPHPQFCHRKFVLGPASTIAPDWRDPVTALSLKQLNARLTKPRPIPR